MFWGGIYPPQFMLTPYFTTFILNNILMKNDTGGIFP